MTNLTPAAAGPVEERLVAADNLTALGTWLTDAGVPAAAFIEYQGNKLAGHGLRIGDYPNPLLAHIGDTVLRHADGTHTVRPGQTGGDR